ncbi:MAG TPA: hypothetical protein V6C72_15960, partial [Chroococcales cyanobacterium]
VFADRFFITPDQFRGFIHECVHQADTTERIALSKEWVEFINPTITHNRMRMWTVTADEGRGIAGQLRLQNICPTAYTCSALPEALAEMVSTYVSDSGFESSGEFVDRFAKRLLIPVEAEIADDKRYKQASSAYLHRDYATATPLFAETSRHEPQLTMARCLLAGSLFARDDSAGGEREINTAFDRLKQAAVPASAKEYQMAVYISLLGCAKQPDKAIVLLDRLLNELPYDSKATYVRYGFEKSMDRRAAAVKDLYIALYEGQYAILFGDAAVDPDYYRMRLDSDVVSFPQLAQVFLNRGHFYEWLGDSKSKPDRNGFYTEALADYQRAVDLEPSNRQALLDCVRVALNIDLAVAQKYRSKLELAAPGSLEVAIAQIETCDSSGQTQEAQNKLNQMQERFGKELAENARQLVSDAETSATADDERLSERYKSELPLRIRRLNDEIHKAPRSGLLFRERALLYAALSNHKEAICDLTIAIALIKKDAEDYFRRAEHYNALGDRRKAIADLNAAIAIDPRKVAIMTSAAGPIASSMSTPGRWPITQKQSHSLQTTNSLIAIAAMSTSEPIIMTWL